MRKRRLWVVEYDGVPITLAYCDRDVLSPCSNTRRGADASRRTMVKSGFDPKRLYVVRYEPAR